MLESKYGMLWRSLQCLAKLEEKGRLITTWLALKRHLVTEKNTVVMYINPHTLYTGIVPRYFANPEVFFVYEGNSAVLLSKFLHRSGDIESLNIDDSGIAFDLMHFLLLKNEKVLFCGGTESEATCFENRLRQMEIPISCVDGYDETSFIERASGFTVFFLSVGSPRQENKSVSLVKEDYAKHVFCCGGFVAQFSASSGGIYPRWIVTLGLRFLYRMITDWKIAARIVTEYPTVYLVWITYLVSQRFAKK